MGTFPNYTACAFPLMRRYCMAGHTGPAGMSNFHTLVTGRDLQLRTAVGINKRNVGPIDRY